MRVRSYKNGDLGVVTNVHITKADAIKMCSRGRTSVRAYFLKKVIDSILEISDINDVVKDKVSTRVKERLSPQEMVKHIGNMNDKKTTN